MRINNWDFIIFIIYGYLIVDLVINWSAYSTCHSPIQLFLLLAYCFIIILRVTIGLKSRPDLSSCTQKLVGFLFYFIVTPVFVYITVQGIVWQVENQDYSPGCIPETRVPWLIWWWIAILILIDLLLVFIAAIRIFSWWRVYLFRRRMHRLMGEMGTMSDLNQILLTMGPGAVNGDLNNQVGLEQNDIDKIPKRRYSKSLKNMFQLQQESCPICFEDFQPGLEVISLPYCEHIFHSTCINRWLLRNPLCPMCRSNVRTNLLTGNIKQHSQELSIAVV